LIHFYKRYFGNLIHDSLLYIDLEGINHDV